MSVALDLGSYQIRSLHLDGARLVVRACRSVYVVLPDTNEYRVTLDRLHIPFVLCESAIAVVGDHAAELTWLAGIPWACLLPNGNVPHNDPPARQMLSCLLDALLPVPSSTTETCSFVAPTAAQQPQARQIEFLRQLIRLKGYRPRQLNAGMAVLLSQAAAYRFTGIGLSIGATSCSYSLARQGIELASGCVPVGADHIDERLAEHDASFIWDRDGTRYLDTAATLKWKHAFDGRIDDPGSVHENILRDSYQELLEAVFTHMQRSIERCTDIASITGTVLPFICCGGPTQINGFAELTGELLSSAGLPIEVGPVSIAGDAVFTVARGCLIHANLDDDAARRIGRMAA